MTLEGISWRVAVKYLPDCKILTLCGRTSSEHIYEMFMGNLLELQKVYESFIDEESCKAFCGYWLGNITQQFKEFVYSTGAHYITEGFVPEPRMIFIDGGVYNGCKVYGFEMDSINFESFKKFVVPDSNITLENLGLGAYNHEVTYTHAPWGSLGASRFQAEGSETAQVVSLDSYVREKNLPRVDCIKLDVEGVELDALTGATTTIKRFKPILMLSAYHKWDDLWTLMNFINSVRSDYEWAFRHYAEPPEGVPISTAYCDYLSSLGLASEARNRLECCLLAR